MKCLLKFVLTSGDEIYVAYRSPVLAVMLAGKLLTGLVLFALQLTIVG